MYPHLFYSARVFLVLAQSYGYAEALLADRRVVPLLLEVCRSGGPRRVASDIEGRRLAVETLEALARLRLWPLENDRLSIGFCTKDLPLLLSDQNSGIRSSAAGLW